MIDGSDLDCVLLKSGPLSAIKFEFRSNQEIYNAFADQCSDSLDLTKLEGARWTEALGHNLRILQLIVQGF